MRIFYKELGLYAGLLALTGFDEKEDRDEQYDAHGSNDPCGVYKSGEDIADSTYSCNGAGIGKLR